MRSGRTFVIDRNVNQGETALTTSAALRVLFVLLVGLWMVQPAFARTVTGAVFDSGRIQISSGMAGLASSASCEDGLLFTFTESAAPDPLALSRRDESARSGVIQLEVRINSVCEHVAGGQASFQYKHRSLNGGTIGEDLLISTLAVGLVLPLEPGQSDSRIISYQAGGSSPSDHEFALLGDEISFFGGDSFGSASQERVLARIQVTGARFVDPEAPILQEPGRERERDAIVRLEQACLSEDASASLRETCAQLAGAEGERLLQVARAFDPHEITVVPGAATELGQIQTSNVSGRLSALRGGATGMSLEGLSLSYNGRRFDSGLLPASLVRRMDESGTESTLFSQRWGVFVNGDISIGTRDERGKEVGFDFDSWGLTSGVDYRFNGGHVAGLALGYSAYSADLDDDGGGLDSDTWALQAYGSFNVSDAFYIDLTLGRGWMDFDQDRVIDMSGIGNLTRNEARGSTSGTQWTASAAFNYRIQLDGAWQITPYGQFRYAYSEIDAFSESSVSPFALNFPEQTIVSRIYTAGARVSRAVNLSRSVMVPFLDLAYEHESGNDGYLLQPTLVTSPGVLGPVIEISDPDRHVARADLGASWVFVGGMQMFVSYSALLFDRDMTRHTVYAGARWAF
ncbi:MAG: autotransporter outer membrane beta-barrel domain-containing protein [Wenzhouxiangella sp.]|nr:MAG: autotransporter outer membrane beta-barrel domain-containing protein [Wenzhouxiangella sp.]